MITNYDIRIYSNTAEYAKLSTHRYKFSACIVNKKRVWYAVNSFKTHPIFQEYGSWCNSIHAEVAVILKAKDVEGSTLYIARDSINPASKPCKVCMSIIVESGIKRIVYHTGVTLKEIRL